VKSRVKGGVQWGCWGSRQHPPPLRVQVAPSEGLVNLPPLHLRLKRRKLLHIWHEPDTACLEVRKLHSSDVWVGLSSLFDVRYWGGLGGGAKAELPRRCDRLSGVPQGGDSNVWIKRIRVQVHGGASFWGRPVESPWFVRVAECIFSVRARPSRKPLH